MAGRLIRVIPRTSYTFSLAASASQEFVLSERAIGSSDWTSATLIALLHSKDFSASASATANIKVHNTFFDADDPTVLWGSSSASALATLSIANADVAPNYYIAVLSTPIGPFLRCTVGFSQGANTGSCTLALSVYLLGRDS